MVHIVSCEDGTPVSKGTQSTNKFVVETILGDGESSMQDFEGWVDSSTKKLLESITVKGKTQEMLPG